MNRLKGFSVVGLIIVLAAVAIAAVLLLGFGGFGFGGGKGNGEGDGDTSSAAVSDDESEETEITPVIENIDYINVTVSGNEYIYDDRKLSLEELINALTDMELEDIPIKITDDDAALDTYQQLIDALDERKIKYIEENMV